MPVEMHMQLLNLTINHILAVVLIRLHRGFLVGFRE